MSMNMDDLYKQMASEYTERYGEELLRELEQLESAGAPTITPGLDRKVRRALGGRRRARYARGIAIAAAGLALALVLPRMLGDRGAEMIQEAQPQMDSGAPQAPQAGGYAEEEAAVEEEAADIAQGADAVIPLSFPLPEGFEVTNVELDNGKSVYYIANDAMDDVVMTLEYLEGPFVTDGLTELAFGGAPVYGTSTADYSLLTFLLADGVRYELTCAHDINTLAALCGNIF